LVKSPLITIISHFYIILSEVLGVLPFLPCSPLLGAAVIRGAGSQIAAFEIGWMAVITIVNGKIIIK
jgi:hypothetical protein